MQKLVVKRLPIGWQKTREGENQILACSTIGAEMVKACIKLDDFVGTLDQLREIVEERQEPFKAVRTIEESFVYNKVKWYVSYFKCSEGDEYRACFYTLLDKSYLIVELVSNSATINTCFLSEAKRLFGSVDLESARGDSILRINDVNLIVRSRPDYKLNVNSSETSLIFENRQKYFVIGNLIGDYSIDEWVDRIVDKSSIGLLECSIAKAGHGITGSGIKWACYRAETYSGSLIYCRYFSMILNGIKITGYLKELREPFEDLDTLFTVKLESRE